MEHADATKNPDATYDTSPQPVRSQKKKGRRKSALRSLACCLQQILTTQLTF
jgi:hypothetical protein